MDAYRHAFFELHARPDLDEPLFPGALEALDAAGMLLGVATGKGRRGLEATLGRHGLTGRFATLQPGDRGKPDPEMLLNAMAETGATHTVMVGDTVYDMEMAANGGVKAVGVSWGYRGRDELLAAGAGAVIDHFKELFVILEDSTGSVLGVR